MPVSRVYCEGENIALANIDPGNLPDNYIDESIAAIRGCARVVMFELGVTPNNLDFDHERELLPSVVAGGDDLVKDLRWFPDYYHGELKDIVSETMGDETVCLQSYDEALLGLVFGPGMRIEAHTDVWSRNANLYLKKGESDPDAPEELRGGTVIGYTSARSHHEILEKPMAVLSSGVGTLGLLAANTLPHTIGVADSPENFVVPNITQDSFWDDPTTRISLNISYSTARQLREQPELLPMTAEVGFSIPVLGKQAEV